MLRICCSVRSKPFILNRRAWDRLDAHVRSHDMPTLTNVSLSPWTNLVRKVIADVHFGEVELNLRSDHLLRSIASADITTQFALACQHSC